MISEQRIIDLAENSCMYFGGGVTDSQVIEFANALQAEWIKSLPTLADQLKAERELGRNEAMENKITSGMELLIKHNVPTIGELLKAEREKAIRECLGIAKDLSGPSKWMHIVNAINALLSTNESKENELKG